MSFFCSRVLPVLMLYALFCWLGFFPCLQYFRCIKKQVEFIIRLSSNRPNVLKQKHSVIMDFMFHVLNWELIVTPPHPLNRSFMWSEYFDAAGHHFRCPLPAGKGSMTDLWRCMMEIMTTWEGFHITTERGGKSTCALFLLLK